MKTSCEERWPKLFGLVILLFWLGKIIKFVKHLSWSSSGSVIWLIRKTWEILFFSLTTSIPAGFLIYVNASSVVKCEFRMVLNTLRSCLYLKLKFEWKLLCGPRRTVEAAIAVPLHGGGGKNGNKTKKHVIFLFFNPSTMTNFFILV